MRLNTEGRYSYTGDTLILAKGANTYYIRVTAEDGTSSDYVLIIETPEKSNTWIYILVGSLVGAAAVAAGLTVFFLKKRKKI